VHAGYIARKRRREGYVRGYTRSKQSKNEAEEAERGIRAGVH